MSKIKPLFVYRLSAIALLLASSCSEGQTGDQTYSPEPADWVVVAKIRGLEHSVARGSIRTMPYGYKRAWVRFSDNGEVLVMSLAEFDCSDGSYQIIQGSFYDRDKAEEAQIRTSKWGYVEPESPTEAYLNFACFGKLPESSPQTFQK